MLDYTGDPVYDGALLAAFAFAAVTAVAALFVKTPYGRFADDRFGIALDPRLGWLLMELPAPVVFVWCYLQGPMRGEPFALFVLFVWLVHYANRGFVMPALMRVPRGQATSFSLFVVAAGWLATALHIHLELLAGERRRVVVVRGPAIRPRRSRLLHGARAERPL